MSGNLVPLLTGLCIGGGWLGFVPDCADLGFCAGGADLGEKEDIEGDDVLEPAEDGNPDPGPLRLESTPWSRASPNKSI